MAGRWVFCTPLPEGTLTTDPISEGIPKVALPSQQIAEEGTSSHPAIIKEEEEKVVEVSDFEDEFNVFNKILSPKALPGELGSPSSIRIGTLKSYYMMLCITLCTTLCMT